MQINNQPHATNFQGYLRFKTAKNVVKTIDAAKIAAIATGTAIISQPFYVYKYDKNKIDFNQNEETKTSKNGRSTAGIQPYLKEMPIEIKVQQLIYSDPRVGLPDKYSNDKHFVSESYMSNPYIEGSDYIFLNDKKMNDAFLAATKSDEVVDIVDECGRLPWDGIFDLNKKYAPIVEKDELVQSGEDVADTYIRSYHGKKVAEDTIFAEGVIEKINGLDSISFAPKEVENKIISKYHDKEPELSEKEKLKIVDHLLTDED